jgi:NAD(P) transhydrogenase
MLGVFSGILASLAVVGFSGETLTQFGGLATIGSAVGMVIGRRITPTGLPQTVAALHSVVGLAAVLTSIGSVLAHGAADITTLHMVSAYLGVLIGGVTFTGSLVAFLKLAARMSSKPIKIPGPRHLLNGSLLGANIATLGAFLAYAPGAPLIGAACLLGNAALRYAVSVEYKTQADFACSFVKGFTTTAGKPPLQSGCETHTDLAQPSEGQTCLSSSQY